MLIVVIIDLQLSIYAFINYDGFSCVSLLCWISRFVWTIYNLKFVISDLKNLLVMSFV